MPPLKQIHVKAADVLAAIIRAYDSDVGGRRALVADLEQVYANTDNFSRHRNWNELCDARADLADLEERGIGYAVERFLVTEAPTVTQRTYCQRVIRQLAADGYVDRQTVRIKPTDAGREWLASQGAATNG